MWFGLWQKGLKKGFCNNNSEVPVSIGAGYLTKRDRCFCQRQTICEKQRRCEDTRFWGGGTGAAGRCKVDLTGGKEGEEEAGGHVAGHEVGGINVRPSG